MYTYFDLDMSHFIKKSLSITQNCFIILGNLHLCILIAFQKQLNFRASQHSPYQYLQNSF